MAINLGDAFQNWNPDTNLLTPSASAGCTVDGGIIAMLEPNLFRDKVMQPGITYSTDVEELMVTNRFASAYIRKLDKIIVFMDKANNDGAFRVKPTQGDGTMLEIKCNDVLKVGEVVLEPIDAARVSGRTADRTALAAECYDEVKELRYLSYLINGGASADPTDVGAPASANTTKSTPDTILDNIIADRAVMLKAGANPDTLLISVDTDSAFLSYVGKRNYYRSPSETEVAIFGQEFGGTLFSGKVKVFRSNALGQDNSPLIRDGDGDLIETGDTEWDWSAIEYILYDHRTLSIVNVARYIGLVDYRSQFYNSTLIAILTVCGGRVRNTQKAIAKKFADPVTPAGG